MEFPYTSKAQALRAEYDSVKETAGPKPSQGLGSGGQEASIHGLSGYGIINLGDEDDRRRVLSPTVTTGMNNVMNSGQENPTGSGAGNGVDSVMMLTLDDILGDLHKKVGSVGGNNVCEVKDQPANVVEGEPVESVAQEVGTEAIEGMSNEPNSEAVNSQRIMDKAASSPGRDEAHTDKGAVPQAISEQYKGQDAGSQGAIEQYKGEVAGYEQGKGETAISVQQLEKAVVQGLGGGMGVVCRTPADTGKGKEKPYRHIEIIESPDWLPKGWSTELKTRGAGSTAGTKDKYYYDPVSKRRFRSRTEVFNFLETGKVGRYKSKVKSVGGVGQKRKGAADVFVENAAFWDHSRRPTKVRWVLNDSEGSWIPFISEEDLKEFNRKEGEHFIDLNRNSADACDHGQGKTMVSEDARPLTRLKNNIVEVGIDLNTQKNSENVLPFVDSWSDPCLEFAVKTLTGALPALDENVTLQDAFQNYFFSQANEVQNLRSELGKSNPVGSDAFLHGSDFNHHDEHPSVAEEQFPCTEKLHGSFQNILSVSDDFPPKTLNRYSHGWREKKFMRQQAKDLLEPLGRKLCKRALDFLKGHKHSNLYQEKQAKNISLSFHLSQNFHIDYGHQEQSILASSFA